MIEVVIFRDDDGEEEGDDMLFVYEGSPPDVGEEVSFLDYTDDDRSKNVRHVVTGRLLAAQKHSGLSGELTTKRWEVYAKRKPKKEVG